MFCKIYDFIDKIIRSLCGGGKEEQTPVIPAPPVTEDKDEKPVETPKPSEPQPKPEEKPTETPTVPTPAPEKPKVETQLFVLLDHGHGRETKGKCSPDKSLYEWSWNREMARRIKDKLDDLGIKNEIIAPYDTDTSLKQRCTIINEKANAYGKSKCLMISVHVNAAGADGEWHDANGWSVYVAPKASESSKKFAQLIYTQAQRYRLQGNRSVPAEKYWTGNFAMVRDTNCPAVLTENLFMDNKKDVEFLLSEAGKGKIAQVHVNAILEYIKYKGF